MMDPRTGKDVTQPVLELLRPGTASQQLQEPLYVLQSVEMESPWAQRHVMMEVLVEEMDAQQLVQRKLAGLARPLQQLPQFAQ
jgi:hypothetical protein